MDKVILEIKNLSFRWKDSGSQLLDIPDFKVKKHEHVLISIKKDLNLNKLITKIKSKLKNKFTTTEDILITRERHRQNLINCVPVSYTHLTLPTNREV